MGNKYEAQKNQKVMEEGIVMKNADEVDEDIANEEYDVSSDGMAVTVREYSTYQTDDWKANYGSFYLLKHYINLLYNGAIEDDEFEVLRIYRVVNFKEIEDFEEIEDEFLYAGYLIEFRYNNEVLYYTTISRYINSEGYEVIEISSSTKQPTSYNFRDITDRFFKKAIANSDLKGACFTFYGTIDMGWYFPKIESRGFDDIFIPEDLMQDIRLYYDHFKNEGELMKYLLSGPPGTGKTESNNALLSVLQKEGVTVMVTGITQDLKKKVEMAEALAPTLLVIDDIDFYLGNRKKGMYSELLHTFLNVLDGLETMSSEVGIIATTNSIDLLDIAAQRPGRFDEVLMMDRIDQENIKGIILKSLYYNRGLDENSEEAKAFTDPEILEKLEYYGFTGSRIYNLVVKYLRKVNADKDSEPTKEGFDSTIDIEKKRLEEVHGKNGKLPKDQHTPYMNNDGADEEVGFNTGDKKKDKRLGAG